mmetsp:Transcript_64392/g.184973  ORF Transcript_64392/g.184973 Transcript_64392/m.184973 type:complete len:171 (-) Transcript_64392:15-527(-)
MALAAVPGGILADGPGGMPMPMGRRGPQGPKSIQFAASIAGVDTDFVITDFGTQVFIVITQAKKIGSMIEATVSETREDPLDLDEGRDGRLYEVKVLFGDRRLEHYRTYARALVELVASKGSRKSMLLGIALKEHSVEGFRQVLAEVRARIGPVTERPPDDDDMVLPRGS